MTKLTSIFKSSKFVQLFNHNFGLFAFMFTWFSLNLGLDGSDFLKSALVLFSSFFFIGIYGYVLNDIFDARADKLAGKYNITVHWNLFQKISVPILTAAVGLIILVFNFEQTFPYLIAQVLVLFLYSVPFIRLKERGILGILADTFYAYVNPAFIILIVFKAHAEVDLLVSVFILLFYLCIGLKNIFQHQADDVSNDLKAGIKTFATQYPQLASKAPYLFILFSWIVWATFSVYYTPYIREVVFFPVLYIPIFTIAFKGFSSLIFKRKDWISQSPEMDVVFYGFIFLWIFVIRHFNFYYLPIFLFLLLPLMLSKIRLWIIQVYQILYWYVISISVNYFLYYSFKLLGVDLKERAKQKNRILDKPSGQSKKQISREEILDKWIELI